MQTLTLDDVKVKMMTSCALKVQRLGGKAKPLGCMSVGVSLVQRPSLFLVQASGFSSPLVGSQHLFIGILAPWRSNLIIPPYVPIHEAKSYNKENK
jgi:hypothetical protein